MHAWYEELLQIPGYSYQHLQNLNENNKEKKIKPYELQQHLISLRD